MSKIRILSIDGGGIRGILPGVILTRLEYKLQNLVKDDSRRLADYFDFFAGTSTGGILSLSYLIPNKEDRPLLTAQESVNLYLDRGDEIFDVNLWQKLKSAGGIADEKYSADELEEAIEDTFKDIMLKDLLKPCIISSYDVRNGKPHFFKQHKSENEVYNYKVKDVARATSAAPTYFEAARIKNELGTPYALVDGGLFANNPCMVAYSEVRTMKFSGKVDYPTAKDMLIISIGTGSQSKSYTYKKVKDWGQLQWVKPVIEIMMSGNSSTTHYYLTQIFDTLSSKKDKECYHRLEPTVKIADSKMDNASIDNLKALHEDALNYVSTKEVDEELDVIAKKLISSQF
jgi:patatin-like phospholipase/acyl hydrolase